MEEYNGIEFKEQYDYKQLEFPESGSQTSKRFRDFMADIIDKHFQEQAGNKVVIAVSHGCAIEELANYFGGKWEFMEEYCALVGFKRTGEKWK